MIKLVNIKLHLLIMIFTSISMVHIVSVIAKENQSACDPQYMDALEARAWMEAQREISQNKNLIFKPDSVLEYTCFDRMVSAITNNEEFQVFSQNGIPGAMPEKLKNISLAKTLNSYVGLTLDAYITDNFSHEYLNDRAKLDYKVEGISENYYGCDQMGLVWNAARCMNFFDEAETDGFFDFPNYAEHDPRTRPLLMEECAVPRRPKTYEQNMQAAFNQKQNLYTLTNDNPGDDTPYQEDKVLTHLNQIAPVGKDGKCKGLPIPTGVKVQRSDIFDGKPYDEHVCPNPGCYYNPVGSKCEPSNSN